RGGDGGGAGHLPAHPRRLLPDKRHRYGRRQRQMRRDGMDTDMLIGGAFEAGTEAEEKVLNPRTGEVILGMPEASAGQIERAVAAARKAFAGWSRTTPAERSGYLMKIAERIEAEAEGFARLEALNTGKPFGAALNDEIPAIVDCYR